MATHQGTGLIRGRARVYGLPIKTNVAAFFDDFPNNSTTTLGDKWTAQSGVWGVTGGKAYSVTDSGTHRAIIADQLNSLNYTITVKTSGQRTEVSASVNIPDIIIRYIDANNYLFARAAFGNISIIKIDGGAETNLALFGGHTTNNGIEYTNEITISGNTITYTFDNLTSMKITHTLSGGDATKFGTGAAASSAKVGMQHATYGSNESYRATWDDYKVVSSRTTHYVVGQAEGYSEVGEPYTGTTHYVTGALIAASASVNSTPQRLIRVQGAAAGTSVVWADPQRYSGESPTIPFTSTVTGTAKITKFGGQDIAAAASVDSAPYRIHKPDGGSVGTSIVVGGEPVRTTYGAGAASALSDIGVSYIATRGLITYWNASVAENFDGNKWTSVFGGIMAEFFGASGVTSGGLQLDATGGNFTGIQFPVPLQLTAHKDFTVEAYFHGKVAEDHTPRFVDNGATSELFIDFEPTGLNARFPLVAGGSVQHRFDYPFDDNTPYMISFVYNGETIALYRNGVLLGEKATAPIVFAREGEKVTFAVNMIGVVNSLKLYDRALTATEIGRNYGTGLELWDIPTIAQIIKYAHASVAGLSQASGTSIRIRNGRQIIGAASSVAHVRVRKTQFLTASTVNAFTISAGAVYINKPAQGTIQAASTVAAEVSHKIQPSGVVRGASVALGNGVKVVRPSAASAARSGVSGAVKLTRGASQTIPATVTVEGAARRVHLVSGDVIVTSAVTNSAAKAHTVTGTAASASQVSGTAKKVRNASGVILAAGVISARVKKMLWAQGVVIAAANVTGAATQETPIITHGVSGNVTMTVSVSGAMVRIRYGRQTIAAQSVTGAGRVRRVHNAIGEIASTSTAAASVRKVQRVTGTAGAAASTAGQILHTQKASGRASVASSASGVQTHVQQVRGAVAGTGAASGATKKVLIIAANVSGASGVNGVIKKALWALASVQAQGAASGAGVITKFASGAANAAAQLEEEGVRIHYASGAVASGAGVSGVWTDSGIMITLTFLEGEIVRSVRLEGEITSASAVLEGGS